QMVVSGDYYTKEVGLNQHLKAQQKGNTIQNELSFTNDLENFHLSIPPRLSNQLESGTLTFYCISNAKLDVQNQLQKNTDGRYTFPKNTVTPGKNYKVKLEFTSNNIGYYKEFDLIN